jgi:hypothetical protein
MRRTFAGPGSSTSNYKSTTDPGKALPSGNTQGGYRRTADAAGPTSSHSEYTSTQDPGKTLPAAVDDGYRRIADAAGPSNCFTIVFL